jgi:putative glutamine amidotransferase
MTSSSPIIGITTYARNDRGEFTLPSAYVVAVREAGGVPVLLTPGESNIDAIIDAVDGFVFAGGGDVSPKLSGSGDHPTINRVDEERDRFEIALFRTLMETRHPLLGVCRGMQIINVATGGTILAHIPDAYGPEILHDGEGHKPVPHEVDVSPGSRLGSILGTARPTVVSHHHQALRRIGEGWTVTAKAADGMVEAMEHKTRPKTLCVLWHPEMSEAGSVNRKLFEQLVADCHR